VSGLYPEDCHHPNIISSIASYRLLKQLLPNGDPVTESLMVDTGSCRAD
jgi:hypothetical protein